MAIGNMMKEIDVYVEAHRTDLLDFLSAYIAHESINPDLANQRRRSDCHLWLKEELERLQIFDAVDHWETGELFSNLVAVKRGQSDEPILFCGHSDTVPVTESQLQEWDPDKGPWSGKILDGKVFGRGSCDMKSGGAGALMAAKVLSDLGFPLARDSYFGFVMSEESGNRTCGVDSILERGYSARSAVSMEPTNLKIIPVIQGEFYFKITIRGKSSSIASRHLSIYPQGLDVGGQPGVNAIDLMQDVLQELRQLERQLGLFTHHELLPPGTATINISGIESKGIFSALAEECSVVGSMLYSPSMSQEEAVSEFKHAIARVTGRDWWLRAHPPEIEIPYLLPEKPPVNIPKDHWLCRKFEESLRACGLAKAYDARVSTTDGNYLADHGIDVVTFGPGAGHMGMHGCNEYIPVEDYLDAIRVYAGFLVAES